MLLFLVASLAPAAPPVAWFFESEGYMASVRAKLTTPWALFHCGGGPDTCPGYDNRTGDLALVKVAIGEADATNLSAVPHLALVQSASYSYVDPARVPARAAIAKTAWWPAHGDAQIAEWVVAAIFEQQYSLVLPKRSWNPHCGVSQHLCSSRITH